MKEECFESQEARKTECFFDFANAFHHVLTGGVQFNQLSKHNADKMSDKM